MCIKLLYGIASNIASIGSTEKTNMCNMPNMMETGEIERLIKAAFPDARVEVKDLRGDGDHFAAYVESKAFIGKTRLQQHRLVYASLQGRVGGVLHALALTTALPQDG